LQALIISALSSSMVPWNKWPLFSGFVFELIDKNHLMFKISHQKEVGVIKLNLT